MDDRQRRGFTLIEVILGLALTAILVLGAVTLTATVDRASQSIGDRVEAEHSGQATLDYVGRELQTATRFYVTQAMAHSIGYRRPDNTYSRLSDWNGLLIREEFATLPFPELPAPEAPLPTYAEIISDGINKLAFKYTADGTNEVPPGDPNQPQMFYMIHATFTVTCGRSTVELGSAVSTLNITGQWGDIGHDEVK